MGILGNTSYKNKTNNKISGKILGRSIEQAERDQMFEQLKSAWTKGMTIKQPTTPIQQPTTSKLKTTTPKNTGLQKPESVQMLDSFFNRNNTKQQLKQQNTNVTLTTKEKMKSDFDSGIKNMVGDKAYKTLPKYGYLPGQDRGKKFTDMTNEEFEQYKATQEWEKKYPDAAKRLKAYDMEIRANKGDFSSTPAAVTLGAIDSLTLGSVSRTVDKSGMTNPIKVAQQTNPVAYTVGNIGGYVIPGSAAEKGAAALLKPVAKKIASNVGQSAVTGAVSGAGLAATEGVIRGKSPEEIAKDVITFGGLGAGTNAAISKILGKVKTGKQITQDEAEILKMASESPTIKETYTPQQRELPKGLKNTPIIVNNAPTQPIKVGTPSNESLGFLPKGFRIKANNEVSYVSETAAKVKSTKDLKTGGNLWDKFYRNFVDNQKSIKDFSKAADQKGIKTDVLANNSRNVGGTVDYILREGLVDKSGKNIGESFKTVIDRVPRKQEGVFNDYMLHRHNVARMNEGKPVFGEEVTASKSFDEIKNYESAYPEFKQTAEMYDKFINDFMNEWGVKSGLIDKDTWLKIKETYPNYVPTYRVFSEVEKAGKGFGGTGQKFVNTSNVIKKATGSQRDIINPLEKTMELIDKTVKTAKYNEVGQSIVTALREASDELKGWAEIVTEPKQGLLDEINVTLKDEGLEGLMDKFNQQFDQVFNKKPTGNNIVRVMENGKPVYLKVNDPEFLKAITGLTKSQPGEIEGFIRKYLTNPFKSFITGKNPIFAVKNISRDIPTAYINGAEKNPVKFLSNLVAAAKDMATDSQLYKEFRAIGGKYSSYFKNDLNNLYKGPGNLEKFNTFIESLPRFAEYRRTVLKGGNDYISKMQGLYNSAEVTTNFARHGDIAKSIDAFIPYFNPSVQGLDKLVRQFKNNKLATVGKGVAIVTIPAVALNIINNKLDPEGYRNLDNRTKDTYYVLSSGDGKFIKIPKTREYGALLGAFFERAIRTAKGEPEPFKGYGETLKTNFIPTVQNIAKPIMTDLPSNKDFAGRTIVPGNLQNVSSRYQYDENTTEIAKFFGDKLNMSPKQLDFVAKSYLGVLAQIGQPLATKQTYNTSDGMKEKLTSSTKNVLSRNFTADPLYNNDILNGFYNNKKKLDTAKNDYKKQDVKTADFNKQLQKQFTTGSEKISKKFDKIDKINSNKELTASEKDKQIRSIRKEILDTAKKYNDKLKK